MPVEVVMPKIGRMLEGELIQWFKSEGDRVKRGEPLFSVMSEKVIKEFEAPADGFLAKILVKEGETAPVGETIALIAETEEELRTLMAEKPKRIFVSPAARKLAKQYNIDLTKIKGTGPGGRIVKRDVLRLIEEMKKEEVVKVREVLPVTGIRDLMIRRVCESWREAPHISLITSVDASRLVKFREAMLEEFEKHIGVRLTYTDVIVKAVAKCLEEYPRLNSSFEDGKIKVFDEINISIAVDVGEEGVITVVVHRANELTLEEIALRRKELVERALKKALRDEDVKGGTFTVTNLGMYGVQLFIPVLNLPQSCILAVGTIHEQLCIERGEISKKPVMYLTLVADHRAVDGALAARFLNKLKETLERPDKFLR
ncbi:hypothetical protein DRO55_01970 [Candidatus Bathyarchaeota archaeon]|nr:MAG: hypothetical protein DRO55_01970 [Candidatus Bathyarchaeota archaeon]